MNKVGYNIKNKETSIQERRGTTDGDNYKLNNETQNLEKTN